MTNDTRYDFEAALKDDNERLRERIKELEAQGRADRHVAMDALANELVHIGHISALEAENQHLLRQLEKSSKG